MRLRFRAGEPIYAFSNVQGPVGLWRAVLTLDTGSTMTMLSERVLLGIGLGPRFNSDTVPLTTASGMVRVPRLTVPVLAALGVRRDNFLVTAHTLPPSAPIDELLGLDFFVGRLTLDMRLGELTVDA